MIAGDRRKMGKYRIKNSYLKIHKSFLLLFCALTATSVSGQQVPSQMYIGNVRLSINDAARRQIQQDVDRLTRSETYYNILVDRMNLYFPFIERAHKEGGIPDEIKFLAIQESALISDAVSSANAVGFWQFKDFTGREVGLRVDRQVDERLNIVSASRGSAKYFNTNNFFFKNWAYAVIAYQAGAGGAKAHTDSRNNGSTKLNITLKTYWYLKKFIAHVVAFSPAVGRPHSEGIWLDEITNAGGKSLEQIAKEQKVDPEELKKYNKWLKRGKVPEDKTYSVLIPKTGPKPKRAVAYSNKNKPQKIKQPQVKTYPAELKEGITESGRSTIIPINGIPSILSRPGDDVGSISARGGISEKQFRNYNDLTSERGLSADKFYYIKKKKGKSKVGFHIVRPEETLWDISQQYGIRLVSLAKKNSISSGNEIKPGRVLWLSKKRPKDEPIVYHDLKITPKNPATNPVVASTQASPSVNPAKAAITKPIEEEVPEEEIEPIEVPVVDSSEERRKVKIHTVAKGETIFAISRLYEVTVDDLLRWNNLPQPDAINIGQNIQVKAPIQEASADKNIVTHTVLPGETLYGISRKYDMTVDEVMDLNEMADFSLDSGQELKVFAKEDQ